MSIPRRGLVARARVDRVIDGDTVVVSLAMPISVRLLGCWAGEHGTVSGERVDQAMRELLPAGEEVVVEIPTEDAAQLPSVFSFGRVLGRIYRVSDETDVGREMINRGLALRDRAIG